MRKTDLLIIVSLVALGASYWVVPDQARPVQSSMPLNRSAQVKDTWEVDGASINDSPDDLTRRFGPARKVERDSDVDQYWFATRAGGEIKVSYFHAEKSVGISGSRLLRNGQAVASAQDSLEAVKRALGEPLRTEKGQDFLALQYDGARLYLRNGVVFGAVIEGYPGR